MPHSRDPDVIDLADALWRRKRLIAAALVAGAALAGAVSLVLPKSYRSTSELLVVRPAPREGVIVRPQDLPISTIQRVIVNRDSLTAAIERLDLGGSAGVAHAEQLEPRVEVSVLPDMAVIRVGVTLPDPDLARRTTRLLVESGIARFSELAATDGRQAATHVDAMIEEASEAAEAARVTLRDFLIASQFTALERRVTSDDGAPPSQEAVYYHRLADKRRLEAELGAREAVYLDLHRRRAEAAVDILFRRFSLRELSPASRPRGPVGPDASRAALGGAAFGLVASAVWILADEYRRRRRAEPLAT